MIRLDYISCLLTVASTILVGRRLWHGWVLAAANSVIICIIGLRTAQSGFIAANLFCLALYGYNLFSWKDHAPADPVRVARAVAPTQTQAAPEASPLRNRTSSKNLSRRRTDRLRQRGPLRSRTSV